MCVSSQTAQNARSRHTAIPSRVCIWGAGCAATESRAQGVADVRLMMKPVGKPDAGNLHVRFDERGGETEHVFTRHRALPRLCSSAARTTRQMRRRFARQRGG